MKNLILKNKYMIEKYSCQNSVPFDGKYLRPGVLVDHPKPDMPLNDAIITRRTVRNYSKEKVPYKIFKELLDLAVNAPSACNKQGWRIIYIDDKTIINTMYLLGGAAFLKNINQAFLMVYDKRVDNVPYKDDIQSASNFINTFILAAHSMGIGSCVVDHLPPKKELKRIFKISKEYAPVALVTFGYYKATTRVTPRQRDASLILAINKFDFETEMTKKTHSTFKRRIMRWIYYKIPPALRKKLRKYTLPYEKKFYFVEDE